MRCWHEQASTSICDSLAFLIDAEVLAAVNGSAGRHPQEFQGLLLVPALLTSNPMEMPMGLTQALLVSAVSERTLRRFT